MSRRASNTGHAVLLMLASCMLLAVVAHQALSTQISQTTAQLADVLEQQQSLSSARTALLAFSVRQGQNSHTHPGHMPCPALTAQGPAQTTCLHRNWGWLPGQAVAKINHLNPGLAPAYNTQQFGTEKSWQYAVSVQLLQANTLGWSQWVDFSAPSLTVLDQHTSHAQVAAVVGQHIEPVQAHVVRVHGPYALVLVAELQATLASRHRQEVEHTLNAHRVLLEKTQSWPAPHENLVQLDTVQWKAVNSACMCRCTRTRCNCSCPTGQGRWQSWAPCASGQSHCIPGKPQIAPSTCISEPGEQCSFQGGAQLQSLWPVVRHMPAPGSNRACQPVTPNTCPTSALANQVCECSFGWPASTLPMLERTRIENTPANGLRVHMLPEATS